MQTLVDKLIFLKHSLETWLVGLSLHTHANCTPANLKAGNAQPPLP